MWYHNLNIVPNSSTRSKVFKSEKCFPVRVGATHICIEQESEDSYISMPTMISGRSLDRPSIITNIALSISAKLRSKLRTHKSKQI